MARPSNSAESVSERRKYVRATLVGSALVSPQSGAKGFTAVLNNVNKIGAGLHDAYRVARLALADVDIGFEEFRRKPLHGGVVAVAVAGLRRATGPSAVVEAHGTPGAPLVGAVVEIPPFGAGGHE